MKRIIYTAIVISLFLFSCESNPEAQFYSDTVEPSVGQEVFFTNNSRNARSFEWDFGDGYISNDEHPTHVFTGTGTYEVTLTAISKNGLEDQASLIVEVLVPTLLEIEIREYYDEYPVPNASVYLFSSITDWDAAVNQTNEGFSNEDGIVVFSNLDPFVYYVDVWEQDHDNYALRDEDIGFVRTPEILPHHINRFVAWVDFVDRGKGVERGARKVVIKKLERKSSDRQQPEAELWTQEWQDAYDRSRNK